MAFVNEYVSDNDVKKFKLDELWLKYHPVYKSDTRVRKYEWTVDRERDVYFMIVRHGREELSSHADCVLYVRGNLYDVKLNVATGTSLRFSDQPYIKIWELMSIGISAEEPEQRGEIIHLLKDALTAYGAFGAGFQVPNAIIEFKNF